jgi:hypothetical protein
MSVEYELKYITYAFQTLKPEKGGVCGRHLHLSQVQIPAASPQ